MPLYVLEIKVEMENCSLLTVDNINEWPMDLKQPNSDEIKKGVIISRDNEEELKDTGGDDIVNFTMKWTGSKKQSCLVIVNEMSNSITSDDCDKGNYVPIIGFECRGLQPFNWNLQTKNDNGLGFEVESISGEIFKICEWDINKQNKKEFEWSDYDETNECLMNIKILDWRFTVVDIKGKGKGKGKKKNKAKGKGKKSKK
eukprot:151128_1